MRFFSKLLFSEVIEIRDGKAWSAKGSHSSALLGDISDVCREYGIVRGEICFSGNGELKFYGGIAAGAHQALRNVIVNLS